MEQSDAGAVRIRFAGGRRGCCPTGRNAATGPRWARKGCSVAGVRPYDRSRAFPAPSRTRSHARHHPARRLHPPLRRAGDGDHRSSRHRAGPGQGGAGHARGRRLAGPVPHHRARRQRGVRHAPRPRRAGPDPPRHGARPGRGRAGPVSRHASHHRPQHRERLLLRLRAQRAVHARRLPQDRGADARDRRPQRPLRARSVGPRRRHPVLPGPRRVLQGRADPRPARHRDHHPLQAGRLDRPVPRPAYARHRRCRHGVQAAEGRRRLLARRPPQRDAQPHLRHGLARPEGAGRPPAPVRGGRAPRPSPHRARDGPVPHRGSRDRQRLLAPEGLEAVSHGGVLHAPPAGRRTATRRSARRNWWTASCGRPAATGTSSSEHMFIATRGARGHARWPSSR